MDKENLTKILATIVIITSIAVMFGWIFNIALLKSILPFWVTMKFSTALSFFFSGLILYFIIKSKPGGSSQVVLPISALIILLLMGTLLTSVILNVRTGIEDLFVQEEEDAIKTTTPGRPSIGTMVNFILISVAGIVTMFGALHLKRYLTYLGSIVGIIGIIAILGYIFNLPVLYYAVEDFSTAMAFHTALLFILLGVGLFLVGRNKTKPGI